MWMLHPTDGESYKGISRKDNPRWPGWRGIDAAKNEMIKMPPYGSSGAQVWAEHLNKRLAQSPLLGRYVDDFHGEANDKARNGGA